MPNEWDAPGVYIGELRRGRSAISRVPTSDVAFIGRVPDVEQPTVLTAHSLIDVAHGFGDIPSTPLGDAVRGFFDNGGTTAVVVGVGEVAPVAVEAALGALEGIPDVNLLVIPPDPIHLPEIGAIAAGFCERRRAMLLLELPWTDASPFTGVTAESVHAVLGTSSPNAAAYFPGIAQSGSSCALGAVAGVIARTDAERGVFRSPAGTDADVRGAKGPAAGVSRADRERMVELGVNPLMQSQGRTIVWGARTLAGWTGSGSDWRYIPVRRTALMIEESLIRGLQWAVFEPNDEPLYARVRAAVDEFMLALFREGAFAGSKREHAYFVRCDRHTMTQADIDSGTLVCEVGFAPLKPAEFVIITVKQSTAG